MKTILNYLISLFNPTKGSAYQTLLAQYQGLADQNAALQGIIADLVSGKTTSSKIGGMNFKQVEEMKNYYLNNTGKLPNA